MNSATKPLPASTSSPDEMLTKDELATKLKVTARTLEKWQAAGLLPYFKISSVVLFYWPDVLAHLKTNFQICRRGAVRQRMGILKTNNNTQ